MNCLTFLTTLRSHIVALGLISVAGMAAGQNAPVTAADAGSSPAPFTPRSILPGSGSSYGPGGGGGNAAAMGGSNAALSGNSLGSIAAVAPIGQPQAAQPAAAEPTGCYESRTRVRREGYASFVAVYCETTNPDYVDDLEDLMANQYIEGLAEEMNDYLTIPQDIYITYVECGMPNAFYNPSESAIIICFELYDEFESMFSSMGMAEDVLYTAIENAERFIFYHEVGHAVIDALELPITGREEDAVDQLATYIATDGMGPGETAAMDAAVGFLLMAQQREASGGPMALWDEHGLEGQRFYNILCWMYGERPVDYAHLLTDGHLPEERAVRCPGEWRQLENAWTTLLAGSMK